MSIVQYKDFSGGMTDEVTAQIRNRYALLENCLITHDNETFSRAGSALLDGNLVTTVQPAGKTGNLINFQNNTDLLIRSTSKLFTKSAGVWSELLGPDGNHLFNAQTPFTAESIAHTEEWANHLFITGSDPSVSSYAYPQKVYQNLAGNYALLNMGMQKFPDNLSATARATLQTNANTLANEIRSVMMAHFGHTQDACTISIATPAVITMANHGYVTGDSVAFISTGTLPTDITPGGAYFVNGYTSSTFSISDTQFGALINTSGTQSGVHTVQYHKAAHAYSFSAAASDESTLITLTKNLMQAHLAHMQDARNAIPQYHLSSTFNGSFGHFYLETTPDPTSLIECVPILNRLKLLFNCHQLSFNAFRNNLLVHISRANVNMIVTPDLTLNALPVVWTFPSFSPDGPNGNEFMTYLEAFRRELNDHYTNQFSGYHPTPDGDGYMPRAFSGNSQNHEFVMGFYRLVLSYESHRLQDAPIHNGAEASSTSMDIPYYQDSSGRLLYAPNLTTAAGYQDLYNNLKQLEFVANIHMGDLGRHAAAGSLLSGLWQTLTVGQYAFAFVYKNDYQISGGTKFENRGTPYFYGPVIAASAVTGGSAVRGGYNQAHPSFAIQQIPALTSTDNWPTATVTKEVYRTIAGGTLFFKIAEVLNTEKTNVYAGNLADLLIDNTDDTTLTSLEPLYTTGGVSPNDPAPKCAGFMILKGTAYYGGVVEQVNGVDAPNPKLVRQSILGNPEAAPETFGVTLEQDFTLFGAPRNVPVAVTKKGVYRLDGTINDLGQGEIDAVPISRTIGSECPQSGALFNDMFYFAGLDGFYMTDGYQVTKISKHLDETYKTLVSTAAKKRQLQARVDILNHRIYWAANQGSSGQNDVIFVLDLNHTDGTDGSFTRLSNGAHFAPTAIEFYQGVLVRGDSQGFVFTHTDGLTADPKVNRAGAGTLTGDQVYVPWNIRTIADELDVPGIRKWVSKVAFQFQNLGNLSVQPGGINDLNTGNLQVLNPIRFRGEYGGFISETRFFRSATDATKTGGGLRAIYKQVDLKPGSVILFSSENVTPATKASVFGSLVVLDSSSYVWPTDCVDWSIAFETDGYTTYYPITVRNSPTTITVTGAPSGVISKDWQLRGIPKDERMQCMGISVRFVPFQTAGHASSGKDGGN